MHLDPLYISVLPRLMHTGSLERVQGTLDLPCVDLGHRHFDLEKGIAYDATLANTGEAVLLSGTATATLNTKCDRCLEPTTLKVAGEIEGYFLFEKEDFAGGESLEEYELVDSKGRVDIAPPVLAAIAIELPLVTLCKTDCTGILVPKTEDADEGFGDKKTGRASPFAALKDFKVKE